MSLWGGHCCSSVFIVWQLIQSLPSSHFYNFFFSHEIVNYTDLKFRTPIKVKLALCNQMNIIISGNMAFTLKTKHIIKQSESGEYNVF